MQIHLFPRRVALFALGIVGALAVVGAPAKAAVPLPTGSAQEIVFEHSGKVLNVFNNQNTLGTPLIQWQDVNGGFVNDQFKFVQAPASTEGPNRYYIEPVIDTSKRVGATGTILDPHGKSVELMSPVIGRAAIWHAEPVPNEPGYVYLINQKTNYAMNVAGASTANGAPIIQWERQAFPSPFHNDHILIRPAS
jgi:hypothetical protein